MTSDLEKQHAHLVSVVIPLVPKHDRFLPQLLFALATENDVVKEIVIARSELSSHQAGDFEARLRELATNQGVTSPLIVAADNRKLRESPNRNRGWNLSTSRYTAFLDADDLYARGRLRLLSRLADLHSADLIVHGFGFELESLSDVESDPAADNYVIVNKETMKKLNPDPEGELGQKIQAGEDSNMHLQLKLPPQWRDLSVHHAHAFVKTELRDTFQYRDIFPGADALFCRELVARGYDAVYLPMILSSWRKSNSAYAAELRRPLSRLRRKIGRL